VIDDGYIDDEDIGDSIYELIENYLEIIRWLIL